MLGPAIKDIQILDLQVPASDGEESEHSFEADQQVIGPDFFLKHSAKLT